MQESIAAWDNEYARLARAASQQRTAGLPGSMKSPERNRALSQGLSRLQTSLGSLPLSLNEFERRRRLVLHLQNPSSSDAVFVKTDSNNSTNDPASMSYQPPGSGNNAAPGGAPAAQAPQSRMQVAMQQQDNMIDELAVGMGRLKDQTQMIGDETNLHNRLLNDMETNLDSAHASLDAETRRAAQLREDQSVWRLQLTVAGLFVLFILLVLMGLS
eukprot:CAMPEP_0198133844 /NCGR_PEP_ID=MMETSP1442-20131203/59776_1 /TAXON_ID= /ORGANISM="Craspedostauros australis, Strain CCMP3328" /LENGTH=214 /DNA_ID=CAMNT_0043794979 /DNA_START=456 /DNA_END=1100 /DNA_ORIENTATION=-